MLELANALSTAIEMEKKGYDIYISASEKTQNRLGKETLKAIAAKEIDHIKAIERFVAETAKKSPDFKEASKHINAKSKEDYLKAIFDKLKGALNERSQPDPGLDKAYEVAMDLEKASYAFYKELAARSQIADAKKFFEFLMEEEDHHYELLQDTLQYLNRPADWFKQQERWVVEG